ncbi:MAG: N-acetyltransferase [Candidatus Methanoperedens sp.]|nr:N-acetyltransferase [Candidatus Methanoperedens sp.]
MRKIESGSALNLRIRPARKEDLAGLLALESICFKEETFNKRQLEYLLLKAKSLVLVVPAEDNKDNIIGSMVILLREHIAHARVYSLNVHPLYRRRSIGSSLMDSALGFLKDRGFKKITLETGMNNTAALSLYEAKGFSVDRILRGYYKNGGDAFHLVKNL